MIEWVDIHKRLPEKYVEVITLLFSAAQHIPLTMCVNSIQKRSYMKADGSLIIVEQWVYENERITHWLDGVPKIPDVPKEETN